MNTAMGIVTDVQKVAYAVVDGDLHEFGTIDRRSVMGFDVFYDERLREVLAIAAGHGAAAFVESPVLLRDSKTWPDFMGRCEGMGEIGVAARGAGVRVYRVEPGCWSESLFRSRLRMKAHERAVLAHGAKLARVELTSLEAQAVCVATYGSRYLRGAISGTLCPSVA